MHARSCLLVGLVLSAICLGNGVAAEPKRKDGPATNEVEVTTSAALKRKQQAALKAQDDGALHIPLDARGHQISVLLLEHQRKLEARKKLASRPAPAARPGAVNAPAATADPNPEETARLQALFEKKK